MILIFRYEKQETEYISHQYVWGIVFLYFLETLNAILNISTEYIYLCTDSSSTNKVLEGWARSELRVVLIIVPQNKASVCIRSLIINVFHKLLGLLYCIS